MTKRELIDSLQMNDSTPNAESHWQKHPHICTRGSGPCAYTARSRCATQREKSPTGSLRSVTQRLAARDACGASCARSIKTGTQRPEMRTKPEKERAWLHSMKPGNAGVECISLRHAQNLGNKDQIQGERVHHITLTDTTGRQYQSSLTTETFASLISAARQEVAQLRHTCRDRGYLPAGQLCLELAQAEARLEQLETSRRSSACL